MNENDLEASVHLINQKAKFACRVDGKEPIIVDYIPPLGDGEGYTSLELLLLSLASCFGSTVKFLIHGHLKKPVNGVQVKVSGTRRNEHPTCFESIRLHLELQVSDIEPEALEKTIQFAKDTMCPVWAMLKNNVEISTDYTIMPA
jgi:putative redox protein